jgi:hypothetical protein
MVSEFNWFEKWIRGKQGWFEWKEMLQTLKDEKTDEKKSEKKSEAGSPEDQME